MTEYLKVVESDTEFLEKVGHQLNVINDNDEMEVYLYMPFWFKKIGNHIYQELSFDKLPEHVKDAIERNRL